jgi:hypothetical protein
MCQSQLYLQNLLFSLRHISALIISLHQALTRIREEWSLTKVCPLNNETDFFSGRLSNRLAKPWMVVTARMCSFQRAEACLYSSSKCRFTAVEVIVCLCQIFDMEQHAVINFILNRGKQPRNCTRARKMCTVMTVWVVHKSSDCSHVFKKAGNRRRMTLVQAGQFPLGPLKMWRKLAPLWCRTGV